MACQISTLDCGETHFSDVVPNFTHHPSINFNLFVSTFSKVWSSYYALMQGASCEGAAPQGWIFRHLDWLLWCYTSKYSKNSHLLAEKIVGVLIYEVHIAYKKTNMDVSENSGFSPQINHFNGVFHDFQHPFWDTPIFGNTHICIIPSIVFSISSVHVGTTQGTAVGHAWLNSKALMVLL